MKFILNLSIRSKTIAIIILISLLTSGISSVIDYFNEVKNLEKTLINSIRLDAKLISEYCIMPLEFGHPDAAHEILSKLEHIPGVRNGIVFDKDLKVFASYHFENDTITSIIVPLKKTSYSVTNNIVHVVQKIEYKGIEYGYVYIRTLIDFNTMRTKRLKVSFLIIGGMIILTFILAFFLQKLITDPIIALTQVTHQISSTKDYSIRIESKTRDEIGRLYDEYNKMLEAIIQREKERDKASRALKLSEERFRRITENAVDIIYRISLPSGDYEYVSPACEKILGYSSEDIYADKDLIERNIHPDWVDYYRRGITNLKNGYALPFFEYQAIDKEGDFKWLNQRNVLVRDDDGNMIAIEGIITDISVRKQVEQELQEHKEQLELLVLKRTEQLKTLNKELLLSNNKLKSTNEKMTQKQKDLENAMNKLQKAQAQLVQSEKMASLGVLTAGIAHEINNPVNFITSSVYGLNNFMESLEEINKLYESLIDEFVPDKKELVLELKEEHDFDYKMEAVESVLKNINIGAERISNIINGLRSFSHESKSKMQLSDIHKNIDTTLTMLQHETKNKVEIIKEYGDIPQILCYPGKLNQVFLNIIINAIQAIKQKGTIRITTSVLNNESINIKISDNGQGIPEEVVIKIFEPFYTTKDVGVGTGLGLYISYNIIKEHDGDIFVSSEIGKGTTFEISLPIK